MPNWCWTSYVAVGDKKDIRDLYKKMKSLEDSEKSLIENGFGNTWLGNLVTILGGDYHKISCRGEFGNLSINHNYTVVRFDTMTAWGEFDDLRRFIQFKYPSIFIYYRSEEPGMGYYGTNDVNSEYLPRIKVEEGYQESYYYSNWEEVFQSLSEKIGTEIHNMEEMNRLLDIYNAEHDDDSILVIEFRLDKDCSDVADRLSDKYLSV